MGHHHPTSSCWRADPPQGWSERWGPAVGCAAGRWVCVRAAGAETNRNRHGAHPTHRSPSLERGSAGLPAASTKVSVPVPVPVSMPVPALCTLLTAPVLGPAAPRAASLLHRADIHGHCRGAWHCQRQHQHQHQTLWEKAVVQNRVGRQASKRPLLPYHPDCAASGRRHPRASRTRGEVGAVVVIWTPTSASLVHACAAHVVRVKDESVAAAAVVVAVARAKKTSPAVAGVGVVADYGAREVVGAVHCASSRPGELAIAPPPPPKALPWEEGVAAARLSPPRCDCRCHRHCRHCDG